MRVLVTGASGRVGGAVASRLSDAGHQVVGLSRRATGPASIERSLAIDISDQAGMDAVTAEEPCQAVVHCAAAVDLAPNAVRVARVNCLGTQLVLALAERWSSEQFVFISSVGVIGRPRQLPIAEDHPLDPPTEYHASKLFGERLTELAGRRGMAATSLRLTSPVGPGAPAGRILDVFVRRALAGERLEVAGAGTRGQDYVDVRDVAQAVLGCLERRAAGVFNVARGEAVTNLDLARACVETLGSASEIRSGERPDPDDGVRWEVSIARAAAAIGYSPRSTLQATISAVAGSL